MDLYTGCWKVTSMPLSPPNHASASSVILVIIFQLQLSYSFDFLVIVIVLVSGFFHYSYR